MSTNLSPEKEALHRAAKVLGGQAAVAALCGYSDRRGVWPYFTSERAFPAEHCPTVERATREKGEVVLCEELRPDVDWPYVRSSQVRASGDADRAEAGQGA